MADYEIELSSNSDAVELLLERQVASKLWRAAGLALGVTAVSEDRAGASQTKVVDILLMIVRTSSAFELLNALAVSFDLPNQSDNAIADVSADDLVAIAINTHIATVILNALNFSLGYVLGSQEDDRGKQDESEDVVRTIVSKSTALELLSSLVTSLGSVQADRRASKVSLEPIYDDETLSLPEKTTGQLLERMPRLSRRRLVLERKARRPEDVITKSPKYRSLPPDHSQEQVDDVDCTAYAPGESSPGNSFLVQVFAHLPEQAAAVEQMAKEAQPDAGRRAGKTLDQKIRRGSQLTFDLTMAGLEIDEPSQSIFWRGKPESVQFAVSIPENFGPKTIVGKVTVSESTIPIGHLKFTFKVVAANTPAAASPEPVLAGNLMRYQQAFISYTSADRAEVLKRVQMLNASRVKFFQDLLTLEPGDRWEKLIYEYIDRSDVFFLFWSKAASESPWVKKEVAYAQKRQAGKDDAPPEIVPIIIEGPPPPKPPEELSFLHFNDKFLYFIKAEEDLSEA